MFRFLTPIAYAKRRVSRKRSPALENGKGVGKRSAPRAVHCLEADLEELFSIFRLPPAQRRRLRTTNVIERLFVEVRRRVRTMCAFTTRDSCERILYSVFYRMNQYWAKHPLKPFTQNS